MTRPTIVTNNNKKFYLYGSEVPQDIMESQFDYLDEDEKVDDFIKYKGRYYHISEFTYIPPDDESNTTPFPSMWNGYLSDSFFSGILIKVCEDANDQYIIGSYYT